MNALIIKKEHLDKILSGEKIWEIRGSRTHKREKIGLIESGSGSVVGECDLIDCIGPLSSDGYIKNSDKHKSLNVKLSYKNTFAWVLENAVRYDLPKKYEHPKGAIIWVKLNTINKN